jgi:hypothetical protein
MNNTQQMQGVYKKDPNIVSRMIAGETILVPIHNNVADMDYIFTLNETAARVWELLDEKNSLEDIHACLINEFEADAAEVSQDLTDLVSDLLDIGAIKEVDD